MEIGGKIFTDHGGGGSGRTRKSSNSSVGSGHGVGSEGRSWQSILDGLTIKARKDGLLRSLQNEHGFEARLRKVMDSIAVRYFRMF